MKNRTSLLFSLCLTLLVFCGLLIFPQAAAKGAIYGLTLCGTVIVPSLFPFSVAAGLLLELRLPYTLGKLTAPVMERLFGVSGRGSAAFFLGLAGGYPLGALTVADMYSGGQLEKEEAQRLLGFCNNCGPAFILAVAGGAVFSSATAGFFLYGVHILAALLTGICLRKTVRHGSAPLSPPKIPGFAEAFTAAVRRAAAAAITVSGFVVFFSVLVSLLDAGNLLPSFCGRMSAETGLELHFIRSFVTGLLELGTGTGSMLGLSLNRANLALCSFILGWGGLSVQAQAAAVIKESGLSAAKHFFGKLLHGILSALITLLTYSIFF